MRIWRNGRRASLRCLWGDPCWFKSSYPHQNDTIIGIFFCATGLECADYVYLINTFNHVKNKL